MIRRYKEGERDLAFSDQIIAQGRACTGGREDTERQRSDQGDGKRDADAQGYWGTAVEADKPANELNWFRYVDTMGMMGTEWQPS